MYCYRPKWLATFRHVAGTPIAVILSPSQPRPFTPAETFRLRLKHHGSASGRQRTYIRNRGAMRELMTRPATQCAPMVQAKCIRNRLCSLPSRSLESRRSEQRRRHRDGSGMYSYSQPCTNSPYTRNSIDHTAPCNAWGYRESWAGDTAHSDGGSREARSGRELLRLRWRQSHAMGLPLLSQSVAAMPPAPGPPQIRTHSGSVRSRIGEALARASRS